jgi:PAS domain S-box-containing protein
MGRMPLFDDVHRRLFDASPNPYLVLDRQLNIVTANRAYLASTQRQLGDIVGRWAWDAFPTDPETERQSVASFERVIRTKQPDTMALLRFDIPRPEHAGGGFETRYWTITHTPVFGADGEVEMVLQHPIDVTEIERMRHAAPVLPADAAPEAIAQSGLIDRARQVYQTNLHLQADIDRLTALFQKAPGFMAVLRGPQHVCEFANDALHTLLGRRDYVGRPLRESLPELEAQGVFERLDRVYASGQEFLGYDLPVLLQRPDGGSAKHFINLIYQPIVEDGAVSGIFVEGSDVTGQHLARALVEEQVEELQRAERRLGFQLELADRLRPLASSEAVIGAASQLLGRYLGLARVVFAEVAVDELRVTVRRDWCRPGMASVTGIETTLDDFGPGMAGELRVGRNVLVHDVAGDERTAAHAAAYAAIGVRAHMTIPLTKGGRVRAVLSLHDTVVRDWTLDELRMAQDMAERTWAAVETAGAQAELRAERDQSQYIFDTMTEGFGLIDRDWTVVRMNATGLQMSERAAHEVIGRNHWEVFPEVAGSEVEQLYRSVREQGQAGMIEIRYPLPSGESHWLEVRAFPAMHGGLAVFFRDITARRSAEDQLRRTAEHLRFTLDAARLGDWDFDLLSGSSRRSPRHDECFGYREPVARWSFGIFLQHVHPGDRERVEGEFRRAVAQSGTWQTETRVVWPDGSVHWLAILGTVYVENGVPHRMAGIVFDISERKNAEEQLRIEAHRKDEFLAMLAHELRNPLAPIGAAADLLVMGGLDPARVRRTSAIITRQVGHMTSLIDDLLDVSRVTRGLATLSREPVDVKAAVADAVEQVRPLIEARRHRLEVHLAPERALVEGDRKRLVQVLANLLGNAAKYTPEGGRIVLEMEADTREPDLVTLCVIDNGIGMTPAVSDAAFGLFTQAERTPDRSQGGLGIGLALVKSLVELHGGAVTAHSDGPGTGSRFTVRLPRMPERRVRDSGDAAVLAPRTPQEAPPLAPRRRLVLVVDDNVDAAQLLAMVLENLGHEVLVEHDPHRALALAAARRPEVCILDIGLPDMDGNELARRLRRQAGTEHALLVAVTGYGRPQDREQALASGFDHHMVKPVDVHRLAELLGESCRA